MIEGPTTQTARPRKPAAARPKSVAGAKRKRPEAPAVDDRRAHILAAAQRVFEEKGLDGANMRAIAREAGYTPGALYFHYASQEEIYADLLSTSLARLHEFTREAGADTTTPQACAVERALAFYDYYTTRPNEFSLGFYLFKGIGPHGLTPELNDRLNAQFWHALSVVYHPIVKSGKAPDEALRDLTACVGHGVGLLLLFHTGRIRMFRQDGRDARSFVEERAGGAGSLGARGLGTSG